MRLILIRHGDAAMAANDDTRTLNEEGRTQAVVLGTWLGKLGFDSPALWHSNKVRTRETAGIIIEKAGWSTTPVETQGLRPSSPVEEAALQIEAEDSDLAIVGHMPFMSGLASYLVSGPGASSQWDFATCGTLILERSGGKRWAVLAFASPALIGIQSITASA